MCRCFLIINQNNRIFLQVEDRRRLANHFFLMYQDVKYPYIQAVLVSLFQLSLKLLFLMFAV